MNERDNGNEIPNAANQGPPTTPPNSSPQSQISSTCYKSSLITTSTTSPRTPTVQSSTIMTDTQQPPLQSSLDISLSLSSSQEAPQVRPSLQEPTLSLSDSDEEKTINKGDSAYKIPYMSGQSPLTSPSISLQQSQQSQISWTSSSSLFLTATSKTPPSIQTVQSPMVTKHTQQPPLQSLNYTSVSLPSSLPEISQVGTQLQQSFLPCTISDEESNFLRAANLIFAVVPKAVRITFDFKHPSSGLSAELAAKESELRNCKGISAENCKVLFPSNKGTVDSREFDITLLVALLRNFTKIPPPKKGWQDTPDKSDTSEGADLVRIRLWRNTLAHTKDAKLTTNEFNDLWKDMKSAISRLSGGLLDSDVDQLETSPMDKSYIIVIRELIHQNQHILNHEKILEKHSNEITMMQRRSIPRHVREIHHQLIEDWVQDDKLYFETQASKNAWASLASMNRLLLYGSPGSGKTATARHLALRLCYEKDYDIVPCPNIEKMVDYSDVHEKRVFVIDDILGVHSLERSKYTKIQDNKDFTQKILQRNTKLLMTCRRSVYKESKEYESFITQDALDVESSFNVSEKKKIFEYHCKGAGLTTSEYEQFDFTSVHNMFPFLCKIFFETESYRKMGFKFFISPVKCLIDEMSKLYLHNKIHYACLVLCVLKERSRQNLRENTHSELKDDICERCRTTGLTDWVIKDTLEYMTGTYTIKKETGYSIMHDAFYETVAYSYGQKFPDQIIKYMSGSYLRANVFVGQREIDDCSIILKDEHYSLLSERLGEDIEAMDLHNVFKNPCFQSPKFTDTFINTIQDKLRYVDMKNLFLRKHDYCDILTPDTSPCGKQDAEYYRQLLLVGYQRKKEDKAFNIRVISWIVYYNHLKILEYLVMRVIENGDSYDEVFGSDIEEQTRLLILSCFSGNLDLVKLILNYINCECITTVLKDVEPPMTETAFTTACWCGHLPIVQEFIQRNADVNRTNGLGKTGLHKASETGQLKIVETLLSQKASCNQFDNTTETPLFSASEYGHLPVVKLLIENGAICNKFDDSKRSPLYVACQFGHLSVVNYLLQKNANINFSGFLGRSPLHVASVEGHLNIVTALIVSGAVCNRRDYDGSSPLLLASRSGHEDIVQKLLEHGADSKISDCKGKTPLWEAVEAGHKPVLQTMMLHHADFNENDNEGKCPMYYAAENAKIEELKLLVKAKNINFRCSSKSFITPLHRALIGMNRDIFCELLQSENKREKFSGNQHLFNILENLRHAKLCLDGGDRVVVFNTKNYCLNADLWEIICNRNETFFKKMLTLDLETKFCYIETYFAKDLLVDSVLDSQCPVEFRKEKVKLLLDFKSIDLKERDEKCISVLEKVRKEYVKLKHERDSRAREYSEILKIFRCRVRRYSF